MWSLSNVLCSTTVCYSTCNSIIPSKWQAWKQYAHIKICLTQTNSMETFEMLDSTKCKEDTLLIRFPSSEVVWTPLKMLNTWHVHWQKTNENLNQAQELVLRNRSITIHEVVNVLGISFWKTMQTHILLLPNVSTACWVRSRRTVSTHARSF